MIKTKIVFGIVILAFYISASGADIPVVGVFSSLGYSPRSGDVNGKEMFIIPTFQGTHITISCGSGVPATVPLKVIDGIGHFELGESEEDALCGLDKFRIRVTEKSVHFWRKGMKPENAEKIPRKSSYWNDRNR